MDVLSPAEELGLSGLSLDGRVRKAVYALGDARLIELMGRLSDESWHRRLLYLRDGIPEAIRVFARPIGVMPDQLGYLHWVSLTILNALKRLPDLYLQDFSVRSVLPLTPDEEKFLWDSWGPSQRETNPVVGRLDAVVDFTSPMWKESLRFVEPNLVGVGGLHYCPTSERLLADVVLPALREFDASLDMEPGPDVRELFIQEVMDHMEAIGRKGQTICFLEPKYAGNGPDEQEALVDYYQSRHGLNIVHADPSELTLRSKEVCYGDRVIDVAYRDYEVRDLIELEKTGVDLRPIRTLFKQNRIISSMAGDFDHKSCWELLTDPQFTQKYFTAEERQVFRRHILWTRVLTDRQTTLPDGQMGDLLEFARSEHELLVVKPNRSYGGDRVLMGPLFTSDEWAAAVDRAVADTEPWVVQRLAGIPVNEFPVVTPDGVVHLEPFYTVLGFTPTRFGVAILGRASQKQVVNVAQRGGMCGVLIGKPSQRLFGPGIPRQSPPRG
jgi:hypothetical protein